MEISVGNLVVVLGVSAAMAAAMELGFRWGRRDIALGIAEDRELGGLNSAVFSLLSLLLAFSFSARQSHYEWRRERIVEEGNAIGTAYLRVDIVRPEDRPSLRAAFRKYVEARAEGYMLRTDRAGSAAAVARSHEISAAIWKEGVAACERKGNPACQVLLPAFNAVIDIAAVREEAAEARLPMPVLWLLLVIAPISALFLGVMASSRGRRSTAHSFLYIAMIALTIWIILDLDNPRSGMIQLKPTQLRVIDGLREMMKA